MKNIFHANAAKKQVEVIILIPSKAEFKLKLVRKDKRLLHIDKGKNPSGGFNCKHKCAKCHCSQFHKGNINFR
jgi:hypothetical protein